jgi:hypothetical protein
VISKSSESSRPGPLITLPGRKEGQGLGVSFALRPARDKGDRSPLHHTIVGTTRILYCNDISPVLIAGLVSRHFCGRVSPFPSPATLARNRQPNFLQPVRIIPKAEHWRDLGEAPSLSRSKWTEIPSLARIIARADRPLELCEECFYSTASQKRKVWNDYF